MRRGALAMPIAEQPSGKGEVWTRGVWGPRGRRPIAGRCRGSKERGWQMPLGSQSKRGLGRLMPVACSQAAGGVALGVGPDANAGPPNPQQRGTMTNNQIRRQWASGRFFLASVDQGTNFWPRFPPIPPFVVNGEGRLYLATCGHSKCFE